MSWRDYSLARKFLVETHMWSRIRQAEAEVKAVEDHQFQAAQRALSQRR